MPTGAWAQLPSRKWCMRLIKDRAIVEDTWRRAALGEAISDAGDLLVPVARFREQPEAWLGRTGRLGLLVPTNEEPESLAGVLGKLALVAVEFASFHDGRGYSLARLLRERYGFSGELRAVGYVLRDQLFYLERVGFNAFELAPGKSLESALEAFEDFSVTYQGAADDPRPLFRRRAAQAR
jgi:uncharacterized protein (DUF934 family)